MSDAITLEVFRNLVSLAALELSEDESAYLVRELNNQLKALQELAAIPLDAGLITTSHGVPYTPESTPAMREDEWQPKKESGAILTQVPELDDGYIVVPNIPHTDLE